MALESDMFSRCKKVSAIYVVGFAKVLLSTPTTMRRSLTTTGKEFKWQGGVSSAMTQTKSGGLESASTLFTT